jgi:hypothetical protein
MALNYIYSDAPLSTIDITDRCRTYVLSVTDRAEEGSVAISNLVIDDPDGDLTITGHRRLYIFEDTAPVGDQMIFNGFVVNERVIRGPSGKTEASRQWVVDLADVNVLINRRIMNGADANRPAEDDTPRIQALLTMTELNTVDDDSLVSLTAATVPMDAVDYRGQNVGNYIDDCRQQSGKNAYIYYNETLGEYGLWYDFDYSTAYDSGKYLSNTLGEADQETVFQYSQERTYLNVDPSRVASGIYLEYTAGLVYAQDSDTTDEFAAIDWAAPSLNVKTLAKAEARAERYLEDAATEDKIVHTVMTAVPRDQVNAVKKGQLVRFKATWMPGFEGYTTMRVLYRTVNEISEDPTASFEIEMDLTPVEIPTEPSFFTSTNLGSCEIGTWPLGPPAENALLVGYLCQRDVSPYDASIVPIGVDEPAGHEGCSDNEIAGTEWTFIDNLDVNNGAGQGARLTFAYRDAEANEPQVIQWGGPSGGGFSGTARPRSHQVAIEGLSGAPTVTAKGTGTNSGTANYTSPDITVPAAGWIFAGFGYRAGFMTGSMVVRAPAVAMTEGLAYGGYPFDPYSWFGYLHVASAGTYNIVLDRTNTVGTVYAKGWIMGFWPE